MSLKENEFFQILLNQCQSAYETQKFISLVLPNHELASRPNTILMVLWALPIKYANLWIDIDLRSWGSAVISMISCMLSPKDQNFDKIVQVRPICIIWSKNHLLYFGDSSFSVPLTLDLAWQEIYCLGSLCRSRMQGCSLHLL